MADQFNTHESGLESPAKGAAAITPNDGADLATAARGIYVGVGGHIKVTTVGGQEVTFTSVPQGAVLPVRAARVWSTGTTASSLIALY